MILGLIIDIHFKGTFSTLTSEKSAYALLFRHPAFH